jgi:hypothetical protein
MIGRAVIDGDRETLWRILVATAHYASISFSYLQRLLLPRPIFAGIE